MPKKELPSYEEMLRKHPDWDLDSTNSYGREATSELNESSRLIKKAIVGHYVRFLQDHGLVKHTLWEAAPDIPDDFTIYLRDVTPEGHEHYRLCYMNWLGALDRRGGARPEDVKLLEKGLAKLRGVDKVGQ